MSSPHLVSRIGFLTWMLLASGCNLDPGREFASVESAVSRASGKRVKWARSDTDRVMIDSEIGALLRQRLTADSAAQIALLNNRALQAEFEGVGISHADYVQAGLMRNPSLFGHIDRSSLGTSYEYSAAAELMSVLMIPWKRKLAASELERAKLAAAAAAMRLVADTKSAFYELQARQQLLGRLKLIQDTNEATADISKRLHDAGNITDLDLASAGALFNESRIDVTQAQMQIRSAHERLNRLMGLWGSQTNWTVAGELPPIPKQEASMKKLESIAIGQRFDLAMARQNVDAAARALSVRKKTRFTPVKLEAGVHGEREEEGPSRLGPSLELELPIFDQGQAAVARLSAQYRQAVHELEARSADARSEVREARDLVLANRDQALFYRDVLLPQRLRVVNEAQLQYNAMQRGVFDLLQAKERELKTERDYIDAWRDYWIARAELERALWAGSRATGGSRAAGMRSSRREGEDISKDSHR